MPADVTGHTLFDPSTAQFTTRRGPVFTNLLLADEINRAPAKTQSALLEVMQEGQVTIEGTSLPLGAPFMVLATQNPIEQEGTYALPEAQLDRFLLKVRIDYPSADGGRRDRPPRHAGQVGDRLNVEAVSTLVKPSTVTTLQAIAAAVAVDDAVLDYARAHRPRDAHVAAASPPAPGRAAAIALVRGRARRGDHGRPRLRHARRREAHGAAVPAPSRHARAGAGDRRPRRRRDPARAAREGRSAARMIPHRAPAVARRAAHGSGPRRDRAPGHAAAVAAGRGDAHCAGRGRRVHGVARDPSRRDAHPARLAAARRASRRGAAHRESVGGARSPPTSSITMRRTSRSKACRSPCRCPRAAGRRCTTPSRRSNAARRRSASPACG